MTKKPKKSRSQSAGKWRDEVERKRDERTRRNALKKEREAKEYLENDENFVSFSNQLQAIGYKIKDIKGDGNCLFRALADQLEGDDSGHLRHRRIIAKYLADHREEFEPFVEDNKSFDEHVKELGKPGTYGGNDSIVAFSRNYGVNIVIHQLNERCWVIQGQQFSTSASGKGVKELHISYHNGDHYSSVRRIGDPDDGPAWIFNSKHQIKEQTFNSKDENCRKKPRTKNDTVVHCQGAECLTPESSKMAVIVAATGCEDSELIQQTLLESSNDVDATISYILQVQSVINVEETDLNKASQVVEQMSEENERVCQVNSDVEDEDEAETEQQARSSNLKSESQNVTPVSRSPQENGRPFQGARPKVKQQNLSSSKRKERAKQEKKTRRMEERREEAKRKQECQNLGSPQTNQTLLVIADLEALAI